RSGLRCELPAGSGDLLPAGVPDGAGHTARVDATYELAFHRFRTRVPLTARSRIQWNDVHVRQLPQVLGQSLREQVGPPRLVIHVPDQRVLDRHPTAGDIGVVAGGAEHLVDGPAIVHRDEFVTQFVIGSVQRDRETHT